MARAIRREGLTATLFLWSDQTQTWSLFASRLAERIQVAQKQFVLVRLELRFLLHLEHPFLPLRPGVIRRVVEFVALGALGLIELFRRLDFLGRQIGGAHAPKRGGERDE